MFPISTSTLRENISRSNWAIRRIRAYRCRGGLDEILGLVRAKDLLSPLARGEKPDLGAKLEAAVWVPTTMPAFRLLEALRQKKTHLAFVVNELMPIGEFKMQFALSETLVDESHYESVSGFALAHLGHIPSVAQRFSVGEWDFEIVDMDEQRIDKILARRRA